MGKCKHDNLLWVSEVAEEWVTHVFEDGEYKFSDHSPGDILEKVCVECKTCGFKKTYYRKNLPKWVESRLDEVFSEGENFRNG